MRMKPEEQINKQLVWQAQEAEIVTGGHSSQPWQATGVTMNIEELQPGDLFVAGDQDDIAMIAQKGASCVMVDRHYQGNAHEIIPVMRVTGHYEALQGLARASRFRTHATVVAVQGKEVRYGVQGMLAHMGRVHRAGRHLSLSLASMPADCDYAVFGASPLVQPDIAIISDCEASYRDTLFETMSAQGTVLIHAQGDAFLSVMARARAAGVQNVYIYGAREDSDAKMLEICAADNGVRVAVELFGERCEFLMPKGFSFDASLLPALMVLRLTDQDVDQAMRSLAQTVRACGSAGPVTLIDPAVRAREEAAFRITNMIDLGIGRQTAILDNIARGSHNTQRSSLSLKKGFAIPPRLANLDFVYTSKSVGTINNARAAIERHHNGASVESIAPDVLMPGDFLVFKDVWDRSKISLSDVLRVVPEKGKRPSNVI